MDPIRLAAEARALLAVGRAEDAVRLLGPALDSSDAPATLLALQAQALSRLGRTAEAVACAESAARAAPNDLAARLVAADVSVHAGAARQALEHVAAARRLDPASVAIATEHARLLLATGDDAGAQAAAEAALTMDPRSLPALQLHAQACLRRGDGAGAENSLAALVSLVPSNPDLWRLRGEAAWLAGRPADALACAHRGLAATPTDVRTLDLAARAADASAAPLPVRLDLHERLVEQAPTARRLMALAVVQWNVGRYPAAFAAVTRAVALDPDDIVARWAWMNTPPSLVPADPDARAAFREHWEAGLSWFEARCAQGPVAGGQALGALQLATNFYWHYTGEPLDSLQSRYARVVSSLVSAGLPDWVRRRAPAPRTTGRLRVAVVSAHLHVHTVNRLFGAMLAELPADRYECAAFELSAPATTTAGQPRSWSARWTGPRPLPDWLTLISDWQPDVLVLPEIGMHPLSQVFACVRLAPQQVALWGHPIAPRFPAIDRWFSCAAMEPDPPSPDSTRIDLAGIGACFDPPTESPTEPEGYAAWSTRRPAYGILQSVYKLQPEFDAVVARVLASVPGAILHATPSSYSEVCDQLRARWSAALAAAGVDPAHALGIVAGLSRPAFLGLAARIDINLDSHDWSGGNTTLEALWFDLPTVTLPGATMRSRHTAAILAALELPQLIARDVDDYVRIAVDLGRDGGARAAVRDHIARHKQRLYRQRAPGESLAAALWALCGRDTTEVCPR
jgi:predicted O-linked N-acetylglucosamine transferase (SPINDLY family)/Flp pilus assembly protein TadD